MKKAVQQTIRCDEQEMRTLAGAIPVRVLRDRRLLAEYVEQQGMSGVQLAQVIAYTALRMPEHLTIDIDPECDLTFGELYEYYERARINFIVIHRVNFLAHQAMINVYDLLEKEHRLRFAVKKLSKIAEQAWRDYEEPRRRQMPKENWFALQDHFVVVDDMLTPYSEKVYAALRDYMIQRQWSDIEVKARIQLALLLVMCARHSFVGFVQGCRDATGVDFTPCFQAHDMTPMARAFVRMVEALGIKTQADQFGLHHIEGMTESPRITWAWNDYIDALRNDELMDQAALKAFSYNPTVEAQYQEELAKEEREAMDKELQQLGEKFKVTRSK